MAVNFPTNLSTGTGSVHTLIDLRENKAQGIGFFDTLAEAQSLHANQRCLGYLAVVSNGTDSGTLYQFTGTDLASWPSNESWAELGSATNTGTETSARVLHYNLRQSVMLSQRETVAHGQTPATNVISNGGTIPDSLELRFDGMRTLGYNVSDGDAPYYIQPQFINDLKNTAINQFEAVDGQVPLTSVNVKATCFIGDPTYRLGNGDLQPNHYNGLSEASTAALDAMSWTNADHSDLTGLLAEFWGLIAATNNDATATDVLAYMPIIPIQGSNGTYRYITFDQSTDTGSGVTLADFYDASNWSMVWNGSTGVAPISVYAWLYDTASNLNDEHYAGGPVPSLGSGANIGASGGLEVDDRIDTIAELDRLRIKLKLTSAAKTALANAVADDRHPATWRDMYLHVDLAITITQ